MASDRAYHRVSGLPQYAICSLKVSEAFAWVNMLRSPTVPDTPVSTSANWDRNIWLVRPATQVMDRSRGLYWDF